MAERFYAPRRSLLSIHFCHNPGAAVRVGSALIERVSILETASWSAAVAPDIPALANRLCVPYLIKYRPRLEEIRDCRSVNNV